MTTRPHSRSLTLDRLVSYGRRKPSDFFSLGPSNIRSMSPLNRASNPLQNPLHMALQTRHTPLQHIPTGEDT